jgi:chromosome segregation ATPase
MTTTTQNLYNELSKLTDNAEQIEALLKVLPGQSYSEDDLRKIINDQKDEAFQQFKSLETKLESNQKAIELIIAQLNPSLQSLSNNEKSLTTKDDELNLLNQSKGELTAEVSVLNDAKSQSVIYFNGEIGKVNSNIAAENNRYEITALFTSSNNPAKDLLQFSSEIAGIITRFGNAVTSLNTQKDVLYDRWKQKSITKTVYDKKIQIIDDFVSKFNTATNQLNTLKTYAVSYESLINSGSGITPSEVNEINSILAAAQGVYDQLVSSYDLLINKMVYQRGLNLKKDYDNSIDVDNNIGQYIKDPSYDDQGGKGTLLIYQVNAQLSRDKLTEVRTNITGLRDKAWTPYVNLISTLNAQITTLENNRNVKDSEYQNKITSKYGDIAQKDNAIISKQGEINTVNSSISTIISQINPNKQKLLELLKENTTLVKEWKALLRNESHYFLDNAELLIYQDLYTDWEKLANNVTAPFLNKLQSFNSNYLGDLQAPIEEYQEDLEAGIVWAKNRRETIDFIGNNSKVVFDQLLQEFRATPPQNSNLPLGQFADNLQKIQERRDNSLTSYDDLRRCQTER